MGAQAVRLSNIDIDNALKNKEFEAFFQPIFDLGNGALARVETFVRWRHPALGVLPPGAFISFFESQGRMSELTRYVLDQALTQYIEWRGPYAPGFSINLALSDLSDGAFASHFSVLTRERGFPAELVTLECPMPPVDMDLETAGAHFQRLAETGARLAIEVRGRANDFLRNIDPFPFDEIKTGGAAILRFARTVRGPGLSAISELLELAGKTNAAITAVGVEDQASLSALRGLGFAAAQGNHLGRVGLITDFKPSRVNEVRELLELDPLNTEDLAALFRTGAPEVKAGGDAPDTKPAQPATKKPVDVVGQNASADDGDAGDKPQKDDLVERLAARIAQTTDSGETAPSQPNRPRAVTAEDRRKAAAIARARKKAAMNAGGADGQNKGQDKDVPARDLQDRLSKEFEAFIEPPASAKKASPETSKAALMEKTAGQAAAQPAQPAAKKDRATSVTAPDAKSAETELAQEGASNEKAGEPVKSDPVAPAQKATVKAPAEPEPVTSAQSDDAPAQSGDAETAHAGAAQAPKEAAIAPAGEQGENAVSNPAPASEGEINSSSDEDADEIGVADQAAALTADETPRDGEAFSLAIPGPTARFRPGIRVGGPEFESVPSLDEANVLAAGQDAAAAPESEQAEAPAPDEGETHDAPAEITATDSLPAPTPVGQVTDDSAQTAQATEEVGSEAREDAWIDEAASLDAAAALTGRGKNFLTRKYQWPGNLWRTFFWPNHFWPRSWTQSLERREAEKITREEAAAADDAAADDEHAEVEADTPRRD